MPDKQFVLDARLESDSIVVCTLDLCTVRLMKNATYPWLLLIPQKADLVELIDLERPERIELMDEIALASRALKSATGCYKLNVAALGNQVSQLHIHVIARIRDDPAWPGPIWGKESPVAWDTERLENLIKALKGHMGV